jgi:hypothetical protein
MASSSENVAKRSSASVGWMCRRNKRFVVRDGKLVKAAAMVIHKLLCENRLSYSQRIISVQLLSYAEVKGYAAG